MTVKTRKYSAFADWYAQGLGHVWLPYAQMKTAAPPLPTAHTEGARFAAAASST